MAPAKVRQDERFLGGGIAHHIVEYIWIVQLAAEAEDEAIAAIQEEDAFALGQEGEGRVDERRGLRRRDGIETTRVGERPPVGLHAEEAGDGAA